MEGPFRQDILKNDKYSIQQKAAFEDMRSNGKYCDFTIKANDGVIFPVHKVILATATPYFNALFSVDAQEKRENSVTFPKIDSMILDQIISYIYTGEIIIDEENVHLLLTAAHYLQIDWIIEQCVNFLLRIMDNANCVFIYSLAELHSLDFLLDTCRHYIIKNFEAILLQGSYLDMSYDQFKYIITRDELYVNSEEKFFNVVISWIKHRIDDRKMHLFELISYVNLSFVEAKFLLRYIAEEDLVKTDNEFKDSLLEGIHRQLPSEQVEPYFKSLLFIPNSDACLMYHLPRWHFLPIPSMSQKRMNVATVFAKKNFYVFGGFPKGGYALHCGEVFNPFTMKWSSVANMSTARHSFGSCAHGDYIFVCGGLTGHTSLGSISSIEMYNAVTGNWISQYPMSFGGYTKSVTLGNAVYCFGESNAASFDPRDGNWQDLSNQNLSLNNFIVIPDNETQVYRMSFKTNEMFDIRNNQWLTLSTSRYFRIGFGVVKLDSSIYVFGGLDHKNHNQFAVEIYNIKNDSWWVHPTLEISCPDASSAICYKF